MDNVVASLLGFTFALILFYIQEVIREKWKKKKFLRNLRRELEYNVIQIDKWINEVKHDHYQATWVKPIYSFSPNFQNFRHHFIDKAFENGVIYELYDNEDISKLIISLSYFSERNMKSILEFIKEQKTMEIADEDGTPGPEYIKMFIKDQNKILNDEKERIKELSKKIVI